MNLIITKEQENSLMDRKEIEADLTFDKETPSRSDVLAALKDKLKSDTIVIINIDTQYGFRKAVVRANVYKSKEAMDKFEPDYTKKRDEPKETKQEAPPKQAEKKEDAGKKEEPAKKEEPKEA